MDDPPVTPDELGNPDWYTDPYRVDPARHRGRDVGILHRLYELARDRPDDDPAGPRRRYPIRHTGGER